MTGVPLDIMLTSTEETLSSLLVHARAETNPITEALVEGLAIAVLDIRRHRQHRVPSTRCALVADCLPGSFFRS